MRLCRVLCFATSARVYTGQSGEGGGGAPTGCWASADAAKPPASSAAVAAHAAARLAPLRVLDHAPLNACDGSPAALLRQRASEGRARREARRRTAGSEPGGMGLRARDLARYNLQRCKGKAFSHAINPEEGGFGSQSTRTMPPPRTETIPPPRRAGPEARTRCLRLRSPYHSPCSMSPRCTLRCSAANGRASERSSSKEASTASTRRTCSAPHFTERPPCPSTWTRARRPTRRRWSLLWLRQSASPSAPPSPSPSTSSTQSTRLGQPLSLRRSRWAARRTQPAWRSSKPLRATAGTRRSSLLSRAMLRRR